MAVNNELRQTTLTFPGNGKSYTTPFEVNVYGESKPYVEGELGAFIGRGVVLGLESRPPMEEGEVEELTTIVELDDGSGTRVAVPAFFFEMIPTDADTHLTDATPRVSYADYMKQTPVA
ncbi:MAG: hypothetical protein ACYCPS_01330 [Candidatus Saccharimonadales bacterium]